MPNTTTARPAPMGKPSTQPFGFPLRLFAFRKTIDKARQVKPSVQWLDLSSSLVRSSDGSTDFLVKFYLCNGELYAACSCYAAWKAQPCYHIAAAAIDRDLLTHSIESVARVSDPNKVDESEWEVQTADPQVCAVVLPTQPTSDRFRPAPVLLPEPRESFAYDERQVAAQANRLARLYPGWDL